MKKFATLLLPIAAMVVLACESRAPIIYVPRQETAGEQFLYATRYRDAHNLGLIARNDLERIENTRRVVAQTFSKVVEYFPEDRTFTPLAKLELSEIKGGMDTPAVSPSKSDLRAAVKDLQRLRADYPEDDYIQVKSRWDEALLWKELSNRGFGRHYDKAQELFRILAEDYREHDDVSIQIIARQAARQYQQLFID